MATLETTPDLKSFPERGSAISRPVERALNPWIIALTVTLATFMEILDTSIANVALPHISGSLGAGQDESTWVLTSYLVANAIILPMSSWLSLIIGRKRFYMSCVFLFTLSSMMCGFAPSLPLLIFFRVLQGASGGGLGPSEQAILADTFAPEKRGMAFAIYGMAVVVAPVLGPVMGGYITDNFSWRWIFFINVPVGIISLLLVSRLIHDPPALKAERTRRLSSGLRIDYIGMSLLALGLGSLQFVLDKGERDDWFSSHTILGLSVIAAVCLVVVIFWEARQKQPVFDVSLFRSRSYAVSQMMMFMVGFVLYGSTTLLPLMVQTLFGYSATNAGWVLTPGGLVIVLMMPIVGVLVGKVQARWLLGIGFVGQALALLHMSHFELGTDYKTFVMARIFQSASLAFLFIPINVAAYIGVPPAKNNDVSSAVNLMRNLGGSFGIAIAATIESRRLQYHRSILAEHVYGGNSALQQMLAGAKATLVAGGYSATDAAHRAWAMVDGMVQQQASMLAFNDAFWILGMMFLLIAPAIFLMRSNKPGSGETTAMH
jgi:MFS transporter, DHA2 family, multidrug resistance protein